MNTNETPVLPAPVDDEFDDGFEDDDYVPVAAHKRQRLLGTSSYLLLAVLLVVGGFVGGAKWKAGSTTSANTTTGNNAAPSFPTGGFPTGGPAATGNATTGSAGATIGQIKLVDGTNIYVEDTQGNTVKVTTGANTTIQVEKSGTIADLKAGDTVVVQGAAGADGTVAATSINSGITTSPQPAAQTTTSAAASGGG